MYISLDIDKGCDLLQDTRPPDGEDAPWHETANILTTTKIWSWVPERLDSKTTDWVTDWLTDVWASGGIAPRILDLGTRWMLVVNFTPRSLYPQWKSPWYPLYRRLGGPEYKFQSQNHSLNSMKSILRHVALSWVSSVPTRRLQVAVRNCVVQLNDVSVEFDITWVLVGNCSRSSYLIALNLYLVGTITVLYVTIHKACKG